MFKSSLPVSPATETMRPNILIVDDRKENLHASEKVLRRLPATIFKAISGNEALSLMLRHRFAVVLLDVQMPEMDGFETAMLMQEHESMRGTPIIFVTAISKEEKYASQAAEIGAVDYIFKPVNPDILCSKVKVYLDLYIQREHILMLNARFQQSNEELERFAYICSHDMQEPVRMMNVYGELLTRNYNALLDEKGRKYLHFITGNAAHLHKMILDILTFSRVGREDIEMESIDCNQLLKQVLTEYESKLELTKAVITAEALPTVQSNLTLLHVLFQNLICNALKFHPPGQIPQVHISAARTQAAWRFCIRDNGIGIEPQYRDRVFVIFQRIHRREEYPGTGIGLSTCKKFIELCGGAIWFESTPGTGTSFFFTIPQGAL